ncbi:DUF4349 domain-containing protein [Streptomyces sp. NPDC059092]|uniref:DUF4349 domain-containing protein n=1 Tax=Streptomyces sp. NPDC059092 TaxID=3346725 RepID=UPI00367542A8
MRATPALAAALLTVSLALAGCGAGGTEQASSKDVARPAGERGGQAADREAGAGAGDAGAPGVSAAPGAKGEDGKSTAPAGVHVIRTAELTVRVKDARKALSTARAAAGRAGGLVQDEVTERDEDSGTTSRIVLRVPQASYDAVLAELSGTGTLLTRRANAEDVTDQVVDVDSRVASQRVSVARVRELMDRATKLSDVVALEGELSSRQSELEALLARQASLKDRTTLATITVELFENPVVREEEKAEDPGFLDALGGGWDALLATLRWIGVVLGAVLPFAAVFAAFFLLWRLVRRLLPARAPAAPAPGPVKPEEPAEPAERGRGKDRPAPPA